MFVLALSLLRFVLAHSSFPPPSDLFVLSQSLVLVGVVRTGDFVVDLHVMLVVAVNISVFVLISIFVSVNVSILLAVVVLLVFVFTPVIAVLHFHVTVYCEHGVASAILCSRGGIPAAAPMRG
eukprot:tig00001182_g7479.t1